MSVIFKGKGRSWAAVFAGSCRLTRFHSSSYQPLPSSDLSAYLADRHQFSPEAAAKISSSYRPLKNPEKYDFLIPYLRRGGLSQSEIEKCLCQRPMIRKATLETVKSKIELLRDLGFASPDVARVLMVSRGVLHSRLDRIRCSFSLLVEILGSRQDAIELSKVSGFLITSDLKSTLIPNIDLLKSLGKSEEQILKCLRFYPDFFLAKPETIKKCVRRGDAIGLDRNSGGYIHAIRVLSCLSEKTWGEKMQIFRGLGLSEEDALFVFRRSPLVFALSANKIQEGGRFMLDQTNGDISATMKHPEVLGLSVKNRLIPRFGIIKFLTDENLIEKVPPFLAICKTSRETFSLKFVSPFVGVLKKRGISPSLL